MTRSYDAPAATAGALPAPVFCARKADSDWQALPPNALAKPSMRVVAVYAVTARTPRELAMPCTRTLPKYKLDFYRAETSP